MTESDFRALTQEGAIEAYKDARGVFTSAVDAIPIDRREEVIIGEWTVKDILAHIIGWEEQAINKALDVIAGDRPALIDDVEEFNRLSAARFHDQSWERVYSYFVALGNIMAYVHEQIPPAAWDSLDTPNKKLTPRYSLEEETEHLLGEHLQQVKELI